MVDLAITGSELRDSDRGRSHAAAHRIAFEALLEPSHVLVCPICDMPQKTSDVACIFGCMFNDLDLVEHLERDHCDVLVDDMVCDFSDPRYLLTTFQKRAARNGTSPTPETSGNVTANHDGDEQATIILSDGEEESRESRSGSRSSDVEHKHNVNEDQEGGSPETTAQNETSQGNDPSSKDVEMADESNQRKASGNQGESSSREANQNSNQDASATPERSTSNQQVDHRKSHELQNRKQMAGVSIITCLVCEWSPSALHNPRRLRDELSSHVRLHIREESNNLPTRSDGFFGDKRLLSCMDFSLEEYFEKEHLTDLSSTINSRIMEKVYGDLLAKHIQCARAECGHSLLIVADRTAIVRHIAAHIRHDEMRLLKTAGASPLVACDCGMAIGSPIGYVYHIVHDHVFEKKKFSDLAATIVSYMMLIVESAVESVLDVRIDFRATRWSLWCAYFILEDEEGDENLFTDSTDLNEHWWTLWESLLDESMTGKSMTLGDTIKLFEMHPFVHENRLRTRKHKIIPVMDGGSIQRSLNTMWAYINRWTNDPVNRVQLASEARWVRLAQIRRRAFLESKKVNKFGMERKIQTELLMDCLLLDLARAARTREIADSGADSGTPVNVNASGAERLDVSGENNRTTDDVGVVDPSPSMSDSVDTSADTSQNHCALHAVLEGRMLCSLYIHRAADRPQMCPFCTLEMNIYKPMEFLEHIKERHMSKARLIYDRYLSQFFPTSKIFSVLVADRVLSTEPQNKSDFIIRCQRSECCGIDPVVVLPGDKAIALSNVDIAVVKHILWHVRNDNFLELEPIERELLTRALMIRLSSAQMRQILFMARRVTKQFNRYRETDVVKYIQEKMDEIGFILFGMNKGLVFQMVFTRRFVRDQSGMQLYPPCVCKLCVDKELPRYSSDRRKRAFVAYAHPVVIHILEHLTAEQLPDDVVTAANTLRWESSCFIDGLRFKNVSTAIKHVLDAHNDLVELSALDLVLGEMGLFDVFRSAVQATLGDQAWQLEEALGFSAYTMKPASKPDFLNEPIQSGIHRPECSRSWDATTQFCACSDVAVAQEGSAAETVPPYPRGRIRGTSIRDMPEESAACYEEFLSEAQAAAEEHQLPSLPTSGGDEPATDDLASPSAPTTSATQPIASTSVKMEVVDEVEDRTVAQKSTATLAEELGLAVPDLAAINSGDSAPENRVANSFKKRTSVFKRARQKRNMEIKREIDGLVVPQRTKALPLKNVIQGSKTVAAALVAALESPTATDGVRAQSGTEHDADDGCAGSVSARSADSRLSSRTKKNSTNADDCGSRDRKVCLLFVNLLAALLLCEFCEYCWRKLQIIPFLLGILKLARKLPCATPTCSFVIPYTCLIDVVL
ncbi:unnamed protein product [Nippostrongylus brasiliensis]|uniref:C2H2-type domain-containing protein n=1 Tax=Nippostrongylus brasiliensis TaxID=27835 RepID=A0A158QXA7_NIPBR|nr:unnamed protein product [Nippostrongylus brasiliensis]